MSKFLASQMILLAKEESSYGADASCSLATNFIEAQNIRIKPVGEVLEQDVARTTLSPFGVLIGKKYYELSFSMRLKGSGTRGTAAAWGDLFEACAFTETASAGSSVVYAPDTQSIKSVSIYVYQLNQTAAANVRLFKILGARGNVKVSMTAGQVVAAEFMFRGLFADPTDVSDPGDPTFDAVNPPVANALNLTWNSVDSLIVQQLVVDMNNKLVEQESVNATHGVGAFVITGRMPRVQFNPLAELLATINHNSLWKNSTKTALSATAGSAEGNTLAFSMPKVILEDINQGERGEGQVADELSGVCVQNSGNDEVVLTIT